MKFKSSRSDKIFFSHYLVCSVFCCVFYGFKLYDSISNKFFYISKGNISVIII